MTKSRWHGQCCFILGAFDGVGHYSSKIERGVAGNDFCFFSGRAMCERSVPLVSQWATVSHFDSCDDETMGGSAGLAEGPKLLYS